MEIRIDVFSREEYDGDDWPPENAAEFIAWFNGKMASIPREFYSSAKISYEAVPSCGSGAYASIEIYYYRPETEKEACERESRELSKRNSIKERELRQLAELKKKYT